MLLSGEKKGAKASPPPDSVEWVEHSDIFEQNRTFTQEKRKKWPKSRKKIISTKVNLKCRTALNGLQCFARRLQHMSKSNNHTRVKGRNGRTPSG